jgi:hypothetical protein
VLSTAQRKTETFGLRDRVTEVFGPTASLVSLQLCRLRVRPAACSALLKFDAVFSH